MAIKVSVVVPVWNPGPNIARCVDGLLAQTMPADEYELVLVDDGSTDGTAAWLDALAAGTRAPHVEVVHTPNSGWAGRPRNIGVDHARGEYFHFVDNDDTLTPSALLDLYEFAKRYDADVVIGKPASDFRYMSHRVYRRNVTSTTLAQSPWLTETLTPHKLFRRALVVEHDIRHPEGPVPFEDQMFVMQAFLRARSIAILADRVCYRYLRRLGSGRNAGDRQIDPVAHCDALNRVLDIIDNGVTDAELREKLKVRFYRSSVMGPLGGPAMVDYDDALRADLLTRLRDLAADRFPPGVPARCGPVHRAQTRLMIDDDATGLITLAQAIRTVNVTMRGDVAWQDGCLAIGLDGEITTDDEAMRWEHTAEGWALPERFAPGVPVPDRLLDGRVEPDVELSLVSRTDSASFGSVGTLRVEAGEDGVVHIRGAVTIDPSTAMGGRPLDDAIWDLRLRLVYGGINRTVPVRPVDPDTDPAPLRLQLLPDGRTVLGYWTQGGRPTLSMDVGQSARSTAAVLAPQALLAVSARHTLDLTVELGGPAVATLPDLQLVLAPAEGTAGGLVTLSADVRRDSATSVVATAAARLPDDGEWHAWLRLDDSAGASPAELAYTVCTERGRLQVRDRALTTAAR